MYKQDMKQAVVLLLLALVLILPVGKVYASCVHDNDWPEKPCLDTPPYSDSQLKQIWDKYYQLKGSTWMEMKKTEMDNAIKNGILKEWSEYGKDSNDFANSNVWTYYHLYGQAPDMTPYYNGSITRNDLTPIITYYYISPGAIILIGSATGLVSIIGFFTYRKLSSRKNTEK